MELTEFQIAAKSLLLGKLDSEATNDALFIMPPVLERP